MSITLRAGWYAPTRGCGRRPGCSPVAVETRQAASRISDEGRWKVVRLLQRAQAGLPNTDRLLATSLQLVARLRAAMHTTLERAGSACARAPPIFRIWIRRRCSSAATASSATPQPDRAAQRKFAAGDLLDITFAEGAADARVERSR